VDQTAEPAFLTREMLVRLRAGALVVETVRGSATRSAERQRAAILSRRAASQMRVLVLVLVLMLVPVP
jgi:hypothetical protein